MPSDEERARELVEKLLAAPGQGHTRRPSATYRIQLTPQFGFDRVAELVPYLHALGVSDLYLSPILAAAPGSSHGYDVVDHTKLNAELGGEAAYARLSEALAQRGMGQLIDFVPNHMGIGPHNPWWVDVLENGPASVHAPYFDIDWRPVKDELTDKVLVPLLGDQFGVVLEKGELKLDREGGSFHLRYFDNVLPIAPGQFNYILGLGQEEFARELGSDDVHLQELKSVITQLQKLPSRSETNPELIAERAREKEVAKRRLGALCEASPRIREFIDANVTLLNGRTGEPRSFDLLQRLLDDQPYRLAYWRVAGEEINYRRFFDINSLAAIRMEDERVFADAHRKVLELIASGRANGLRIDHPDGLYDPTTYFRRLQVAYLVTCCRALDERAAADGPWELEPAVRIAIEQAMDDGRLPRNALYVLAEKILSNHERIPESWAIDGTTGYDMVVAASGVFVDNSAGATFTALYEHFVGARRNFARIVYEKKKQIMSSTMASEINMLGRRLNRISETNRRTRDFTLNELTRALVEFIACFPVYRTYVTGPDQASVSERDRRYVEQAIARAKRTWRTSNVSVFDFVRDVILLRYPESLSDDERATWLEFTRKLQQVTGPVSAKAVEDTSFYNYHRLISLNEVGGDPQQFGTSVEEFHTLCRERQIHWPATLNATSTHDTKRSEDVRARLSVLTELPNEWGEKVGEWAKMNQQHFTEVDGELVPDRDDELLLYQTLVGTLPEEARGAEWKEYVDRICAYMEKAQREAKVHSSWANINVDHEAATQRFIRAVLESEPFLTSLTSFVHRIAETGHLNSLGQVALKCFAPGVPDIYQGCELWDLSLVDPDNRRPVDYVRRELLLASIAETVSDPKGRAALCRELSATGGLADGRIKLLLLREALHLRRDDSEFFLRGEYRPLQVEGAHAANVLAFARVWEGRVVLCVVPRLTVALPRTSSGAISWEGVLQLPEEAHFPLKHVVTGESITPSNAVLPLSRLLSGFPIGIWSSAEQPSDSKLERPGEPHPRPIPERGGERQPEVLSRSESQDPAEPSRSARSFSTPSLGSEAAPWE